MSEQQTTPPAADRVAALLTVERALREASTLERLRLIVVNRIEEVVPTDQALMVHWDGAAAPRVVAISNLPGVDRNTPQIQWLERVVRWLRDQQASSAPRPIDQRSLPQEMAADWLEFNRGHTVWLPLIDPPTRQSIGGVWLTRATPWSESDRLTLAHFAATAAHALAALRARQRQQWRSWPRRRMAPWLLMALLLAGLVAIRVPLSVLATAEVVAREPLVVSSPLDGTVERVAVTANQAVDAGELLVELDATLARNELRLAERRLSVARAELRQARQEGFVDARRKGAVGELEARVALLEAEREYARERLERTRVVASRAGIAVVEEPEAWQGRPVQVGERILLLADPERIEIELMVPVHDAVVLAPGARARLFLDVDPLQPLEATLERAEYLPRFTRQQILAYRLLARLDEGQSLPRIGLRGTARLQGEERVALGYLLLRRPLTLLRQTVGW